MVFDPVRVPPLFRINLDAFQLHAEMVVVSAGHAGHTALAHDLALLHHVAFMHGDLAQVSVDRLQPIAVVHHNAVAVDAQGRRVNHATVIGGFHANMLRDGQGLSQMDLLVDLFSLINVVADVGKIGFHFGIGLLPEGLRP
jgi:hypothetical protein